MSFQKRVDNLHINESRPKQMRQRSLKSAEFIERTRQGHAEVLEYIGIHTYYPQRQIPASPKAQLPFSWHKTWVSFLVPEGSSPAPCSVVHRSEVRQNGYEKHGTKPVKHQLLRRCYKQQSVVQQYHETQNECRLYQLFCTCNDMRSRNL